MRVLHFYKTAWPDSTGGVEQFVHQLARGTAALGIDTDVLSLARDAKDECDELDGYHLHRVPLAFEIASTGFALGAFSRFSVLASKADVVHFHFPWPFMDLVHFATRVGKPSVLTYHSDIIRQEHLLRLYRPLQSRFLRSVDRVVATSPNYLRSSKVLQELKRVDVIPIGIDKATYPIPDHARMEALTKQFGSKFLLFVGMLRYYKGLHILIEALAGTSIPVLIVGSGPVEAELRQRVRQLGLSNFHFLGFVSDQDRSALLALCFAVIFPSHLRSEAFGISLLEGAMFGKPMISSEIGTGTTYVNVDGETGLVVPPSDPVALRQAILALWNAPDEAKRMGINAEARYWQFFTAKTMVDRYVELYDQLLTQ